MGATVSAGQVLQMGDLGLRKGRQQLTVPRHGRCGGWIGGARPERLLSACGAVVEGLKAAWGEEGAGGCGAAGRGEHGKGRCGLCNHRLAGALVGTSPLAGGRGGAEAAEHAGSPGVSHLTCATGKMPPARQGC